MILVDFDFYTNFYHGKTISEDFFNNNVDQAIDIVNDWCRCYFDDHVLEDLIFTQDQIRVKKAVCAQVEYFSELGGNTEMSKANHTVTSLSVGNFSMANSGSSGPSSLYSSKAYNYLRPTGLLYGGISQYGF